MNQTKRNLEEEFDMYFDFYMEHWAQWIESGDHPFTRQQVMLLNDMQYSGDLKAISKKRKILRAQLEEELGEAINILFGCTWRYYKWCEPLHITMAQTIAKHKNNVRFAKTDITLSGLSTKLSAKLKEAGIITPLHVVAERRIVIQKLVGPNGYKELEALFEYYELSRVWE